MLQWAGAGASSECPLHVPQWVRGREAQHGSQTWAVSSAPQLPAVSTREAAWGEERARAREGRASWGGEQGSSGLTSVRAHTDESEGRSVVSDPLQPHGLYSPGNSPGLHTGVG